MRSYVILAILVFGLYLFITILGLELYYRSKSERISMEDVLNDDE